MTDYKKLQNGSDIRGIALPGVEGESPNLGAEATFRLTRGFVIWLSEKIHKPVKELCLAVGHDSRLSANELKEEIINSILPLGAKVFDCGLASTPAMFMTTVFDEYACDGSIMITASHLPFNRNGFKYFTAEGGLNKSDISTIISYAESDIVLDLPKINGGVCEKRDLISRYSAHLRDKIATNSPLDKPLEGLKIMVDAGNGAGGFYAKNVLEPLGADVSSSQFLEPDGNFPNHMPNPENKEAMASASKRLLDAHADLGLVFDTDVDRFSAIDKDGNEINRDKIVAMASALIAREHPGTTIVTDSITSPELTDYLENCLGLKHLRFKRGYRNVINKSIELNEQGIDSELAIETSGHAAYRENYFLDDGAYLATKLVIKAAQLKQFGEDISCLIAPLKMPIEDIEKRFPVSSMQIADEILEKLENWDKIDGTKIKLVTPNYEGVRLEFDLDDSEAKALGLSGAVKGWCLLRKSLHDPLMPLNVQVSLGKCDDIVFLLNTIVSFE